MISKLVSASIILWQTFVAQAASVSSITTSSSVLRTNAPFGPASVSTATPTVTPGTRTSAAASSPATTAVISLSSTSAIPSFTDQPIPSNLCISFAGGELPTTTVPAKPVVSGFTQNDLESLWAVVEANGAVERANITTILMPLTNFTVGPDPPPFRPDILQYTTQNLTLPKGFKYGVASAAQQVEGAAKDGGRGPTHWDYGCHTVRSWCSGFAPDVTVNTYYQYKQDIQRLKAMGVNTLSFSISWSRIMPFATRDSPINKEGMDFYDDFINELLKNGIEPVATLFHWDTPMNLMLKYGAFFDGEIVNDFNHYASVVFKAFGDRVKTWATFNEPNVYCGQYTSYPFIGYWPQGINATTALFPCAHNLLLAHANAVQTYRDLVKQGTIIRGEIGMKFDSFKPLPHDVNSADDVELTERFQDFHIGLYAQAIYVNGTYPPRVRNTVPKFALPDFTPAESALLTKSADFFAIDAYTTGVVKTPVGGIQTCVTNLTDPNWPICADFSTQAAQWTLNTGWAVGAPSDALTPWLTNDARFVRRTLQVMSDSYPAPNGIFLSEFGYVEPMEELRTDLYTITWDAARTSYILDMLNEVLLSIHEDKVNVRGAFVWSYVDNFEWNSGLQAKFGLQYVNHSSFDLKRSYKTSFFQVRNFFRQHLQD